MRKRNRRSHCRKIVLKLPDLDHAKSAVLRMGNWLTQDQARPLLEKADGDDLRNARDLAMISVLVGCGLRRAELSALTVEGLQIRQGHWAIVDLVGKGGHVRTVPMPAWVKDRWRDSAKVTAGRIFRAVSRHGTPWGRESLRMSFGTWCEVSLSGCNWTISGHMIFAGRALGSAI